MEQSHFQVRNWSFSLFIMDDGRKLVNAWPTEGKRGFATAVMAEGIRYDGLGFWRKTTPNYVRSTIMDLFTFGKPLQIVIQEEISWMSQRLEEAYRGA